MSTTFIEKLDKSRYNLMKWLTVGWVTWFGGFIVKDLITYEPILWLIILIGFVGWAIFTVSLIRFVKLGKLVSSDSNLKNALNDELTSHNQNKSLTIGFWTFGLLICIFLVLSMFINIPTLIVCEITLYIGILSTLVSSLILNKG